MSAPGKKTSKALTLLIGGFILIGLWFVAPLCLPIFRWTKVDFHELSMQTKIDEKKLCTTFIATVRYAPRSSLDPLPWQLLKMDPPWDSVYPDADNEDHYAQRISFISDRDATAPSTLRTGSLYQDRYFTARVWRFPNGTFGFYATRPVVMFDAFSLDKLMPGDAYMLDYEMHNTGNWEQDPEGAPEK